MKRIIYTRLGGGVSVVGPAEGYRLATRIRIGDKYFIAQEQVVAQDKDSVTLKPISVDRIFRRWPVKNAVVEWAETEEEFLARVMKKSVPPDAKDVYIVDEADIPKDRSKRDAWRIQGGKIVGHK